MNPHPQEPVVPELTRQQIEELTEIVFLPIVAPEPCDAIFVFGGTYPGHWQQTIAAYHQGYGARVIVTGGVKAHAFKHPTWPDAQLPEAVGIWRKLVEGGVKRDAVVCENRSRNTLENVVLAQEVFDFSALRSMCWKELWDGTRISDLGPERSIPHPLHPLRIRHRVPRSLHYAA